MSDEIKEILDDLLFTTTIPNALIKLNKEKLNQLKDYITNLQDENEKLKELCDKYEEEHSTKFNEWVFDKRENEKLKNDIEDISVSHFFLFKRYEDYKSRCEKGIAICDEMLEVLYDYKDRKVFEDIKDALTGGDKE